MEKVTEQEVKQNGHPVSVITNGHVPEEAIVCPEMCVYCFDVLVAHLTKSQSPRSPHFTNAE